MPSRIESEATKYEAQLKALVKNNAKVTNAQAKTLVQGATTEVKALYLAGFITNHADQFEPAAKATLESFVAGASLQKTALIEPETGASPAEAEPGLAKGDDKNGVTYKKPDGSLVAGGIGDDDPVQGALGDCYFISSMAAVANSHPEILQKAIKDNGNGTYTVSFWQHDDMNAAPTKVNVTVDGKLPEASGTEDYATSRSGKELWPEIVEKAYAQWKGSYEDIQGGMGANALSALTGAKPGYFPVDSAMQPDDVWKKLQSATAGGGCVVADSTAFGEQVKGVIGDHTYAVLGVQEKDGQKLVQLRNPWGEKEPGKDGKDDGIFTLPIEQFIKAYGMVEYVKP